MAVQRQLARLEDEPAWDMPALLWQDIPASPVPLLLLRALSWALPLVALAGLWFPGLWFAAMALFGTNILFELWLERTVAVHMSALWYLQRVLATARAVAARPVAGLEKEQSELAAHLEGTQALSRKVLLVSVNDRFDVTGFLRAALLVNSIVFFRARELVLRQRERLRAVYRAIGLLDAAQAIASFRAQNADHCLPAFAAKGDRRMCVENIRHPALAAPVGNDLDLAPARSLLVTGSNMSGKTTFLKTIGVSAILAQTIHTVLASRYELGMVRVLSSVDTLDDISRGKSYYMDEVESVLRLVRAAGTDTPALFVVDEVFRGTNPVERVAAATEVLDYLARDDLVLAATHDLEICSLLADRFDTVHFQEQVTESEILFDYALRPGPCVSRNAIALLRLTGYPAEIVDAASRRAGGGRNSSG